MTAVSCGRSKSAISVTWSTSNPAATRSLGEWHVEWTQCVCQLTQDGNPGLLLAWTWAYTSPWNKLKCQASTKNGFVSSYFVESSNENPFDCLDWKKLVMWNGLGTQHALRNWQWFYKASWLMCRCAETRIWAHGGMRPINIFGIRIFLLHTSRRLFISKMWSGKLKMAVTKPRQRMNLFGGR